MDARLVRDIMNDSPVTVSPDDSLGVAGRAMMDSGQRSIPVVTGAGEICGIVTDRDLRLAADSPLLEETPADILDNLKSHSVREIMTTAVHSIEADAPIIEAAQLMRVANISGLPVVEYDETGNHEHLVGLITRSALLDHLIRLLEEQEEPIEGEASEDVDEQAVQSGPPSVETGAEPSVPADTSSDTGDSGS